HVFADSLLAKQGDQPIEGPARVLDRIGHVVEEALVQCRLLEQARAEIEPAVGGWRGRVDRRAGPPKVERSCSWLVAHPGHVDGDVLGEGAVARQPRDRIDEEPVALAACQKGLSVGFTTAAALVHELIEARDEKRLLRLQRQLAGYKLLVIDELGYVPLSQ